MRQSLNMNKPVIGRDNDLRQSGYSIHRQQSNQLPLAASASVAQVQFKVVNYNQKKLVNQSSSFENNHLHNAGTNYSSNINLGMIGNANNHKDMEGNRNIDMGELQQLLGN